MRRRKPLILRGARQVGKSTLVRQFANQQNLLLNEINLERHLELNKVFATLDIAVIRGEAENCEKAVRFDMNQPSRQQVTCQVPTAGKYQKTFFELLSLPLYGVGELERLLEPECTFPLSGTKECGRHQTNAVK